MMKKFNLTSSKNLTENRKIKATAKMQFFRNEEPYFSITGEIYKNQKLAEYGCIHEEIEKHFPYLKKYIKWHLCSTKEPIYYLENTLYLAGDLDCWGGKKEEVRSYRYNVLVNNQPIFDCGEKTYKYPDWKTANKIRDRLEKNTKNICGLMPIPWLYYEGKEREFNLARNSAIWPEATDEILSLPKEELRQKLVNRLPALMQEFKADMIELFGDEIKNLFEEK
jgi:hypothetical protein